MTIISLTKQKILKMAGYCSWQFGKRQTTGGGGGGGGGAFFDIRVFSPCACPAPSYRNKSPMQCYKMNEQEKRRIVIAICNNVHQRLKVLLSQTTNMFSEAIDLSCSDSRITIWTLIMKSINFSVISLPPAVKIFNELKICKPRLYLHRKMGNINQHESSIQYGKNLFCC